MKKIATVQGSTFLPEGVVISKKKSNPRSNFNLGNIYWGVLISPKISTGEYFLGECIFTATPGSYGYVSSSSDENNMFKVSH